MLMAHGYCLDKSFFVQAADGVKITNEHNALTIEIDESIVIKIKRHSHSPDTDHWHSTDYVQYMISAQHEEGVLFKDAFVSEFKLVDSEMNGEFYFLTRYNGASNHDNGYGTQIRGHVFNKGGMYKKLPGKECNCQKEDIGLRGCTDCMNGLLDKLLKVA